MKRWELFLLVEFVALLIALLMPVTPAKLGSSDWSPAQVLFAEPSYLEDVGVYFVLINLIIASLGALWMGLERTSHRRDNS